MRRFQSSSSSSSTTQRYSLVLALLALALAAPASAAKPRVTLITDSVAGSLAWAGGAERTFAAGLDVRLELHSCSRLVGAGCPADAGVPPSTLETVRRLGRRAGPNVVIGVGYNDAPEQYRPGIEAVLRALRANGVQHVFWLTLRAVRHPYLEDNAAIVAAARRHPELTVLDWNAYSRSHPSWFQADGLHLEDAGALALARFMRAGVLKVLHAPPPAVLDAWLEFPRATVVPGFAARLRASGGRAPYRFTALAVPPGLRVARDGRVTGTPARGGEIRVRIADAAGAHAVVSVPLQVG